MPNLHAAVAASLIRTLHENLVERRVRVRMYQTLLGTEKRLELVPHQAGSACLTQVVRVLPKVDGADAASDLIEALRRAGYEVQGSYIPIHLLTPYRQLATRSLSRAQGIWADLIELPLRAGSEARARGANRFHREANNQIFMTWGCKISLTKRTCAF
jgi:dTDP-4-amino-4,6-dideoxygalactose transaminase